MSKKLVLYNLDLSPPVRAVKVVAKLLDLDLEIRNVNLMEQEHLKEPYISLNPEHTVPTVDGNGFIVWDSHAICSYLVDKYGKDDKLYPKDLQLRARCNQRLFFDAASFFSKVRDISAPIFRQGCTEIPQEKVNNIHDAYVIFEAFLATDPFLVGQNLTIADVSYAVSLQFLEIFAPIDAAKYRKIAAWKKRVNQAIPFFGEMNDHFPVGSHRRLGNSSNKPWKKINKRNKQICGAMCTS